MNECYGRRDNLVHTRRIHIGWEMDCERLLSLKMQTTCKCVSGMIGTQNQDIDTIPPPFCVIFQRATFRSGLGKLTMSSFGRSGRKPDKYRAIRPHNLLGKVPKSRKRFGHGPILDFLGWESGVLNPKTMTKPMGPLPIPKSIAKCSKSDPNPNYLKSGNRPTVD